MFSDESFDVLLEEDDSAVYATAPPSGVLSVHIKLIRDINEAHISLPDPELYVRIKVGSFVKSTKTVMAEKNVKVAMDDLKHFSVKVSRKRSDPSNEVRFDLVVVESPHVHRIVGHHDMHLYDIIKNLFVAGTHDFKYRNQTVATVDLEMCFTYGIFGYGCCHQLQNRRKSISDIVGHSLLLRVQPPESRCQPNAGHVMTATHIGHPEFINFPTKADIGSSAGDISAESSKQDVFGAGLDMQEPIILTRTMRKRLHRIQTDFAQQESRVQRKKFLERLILRHIHDHHAIDEKDAGQGEEGAGTSTGPVDVEADTYGTDSDYAESATDLRELMSSMLSNAPGLVSRAPAARRMQPSLIGIGEENADEDSAGSDVQVAHPLASEDDPSLTRPPTANEGRRRSTLVELPGLLVRAFASRLTSWRTTRGRPAHEPIPVVVTGEESVSGLEGGRSFTESKFRSRMAKQEDQP